MDYHFGNHVDKDEGVSYQRTTDQAIGDGMLELIDLKVPRQFMASSADQWVQFSVNGRLKFNNQTSRHTFTENVGLIADPVYSPVAYVTPTSWSSGYDELQLIEHSNGDRMHFVRESSTTYALNITNDAENNNRYLSIQARPRKYYSKQDALKSVNEALLCAKIHSYHSFRNRNFLSVLGRFDNSGMKFLSRGSGTASTVFNPYVEITGEVDQGTSTNLSIFAYEVCVYNKASSNVTSDIILEFKSLDEDLDQNATRVNCGRFDFRPGWSRCTNYDVFTGTDRQAPDEGPQRTQSETGADAEAKGRAYHNTAEVKREGFHKMAAGLFGTDSCKLSYMRYVKIDEACHHDLDVWIAFYTYGPTGDATVQAEHYNAVAPQLVEGVQTSVVQDGRDGNTDLVLSPVMQTRLNLSDTYTFRGMERRGGDVVTDPNDDSKTVTQRRDLLYSHLQKICLTRPFFNDVISIAPLQYGEFQTIEARTNEMGERSNNNFQFKPTQTDGPYEDYNQIRLGPKRVRTSTNSFETNLQVQLMNPLTKVVERIQGKSHLPGSLYVGASLRVTA